MLLKFSDRLHDFMAETGKTVREISDQLHQPTHIVAGYLTGISEPYESQLPDIADALGVPLSYFYDISDQPDACFNVPIADAAKALGKSKQFIALGLQQNRLPFGWAVKLENWSYYISSKKFEEYTGIKITAAPKA